MSSSLVLEWLGLALRWFHLVAGIAWIGSSFYFMWLDASLEKPKAAKEDVEGELWMVHSGGFYQVEKRLIGPGRMPETLHWFKWEAAFTWLSGILLLSVVYYLTGGGSLLVDPMISSLTPNAAIGVSIGFFVASWLVYDLLWQSPLGKGEGKVATAISFALLAGAVYGLCHTFSGRAAYIHMGAMLGTLMVANVWVRILPAQQAMIDATKAGRTPDYTLGHRAKRRSVHNSYLTFPVLFMMVSNHYPSTFGNRLSWLVLLLLIFVGAGVRHVMIVRMKNQPGTWVLAPVAAALAAVVYLTIPSTPTPAATTAEVRFADVQAIFQQRCVPCHSASPTDDTWKQAPNGVMFDTPQLIRASLNGIRLRVVEQKTMPLANKTNMTDDERSVVAQWIGKGAPLD